MHIQQKDLYQQLRAEAIATRERIAGLVQPLDPSKLNEHPEPEGWSVAQVLEHLCVADGRYEAMDDAASCGWKAIRISPALPSWAPKMNLGDGFRIHIVHLTRHSHQIERLVAKL